jgi:putative glutamine amidotransferase
MLQSSDEGGARPLVIGITTKHGDAEWVQRNTRNYVNMVRELGATPVILAPDQPAILPTGATYAPDATGRLDSALLNGLDGIIFSGGGDVHPRYFGQPLGRRRREHHRRAAG